MFVYNDEYKTNIRTINGVVFSCDEYKPEYDLEAERLARLYVNKIADIVSTILPDIQSFFNNESIEITAVKLKESLGMPMIDLVAKTISYCNQTLDDEHIIIIEYNDDFDHFENLCIDG